MTGGAQDLWHRVFAGTIAAYGAVALAFAYAVVSLY